MIIEHGDPVWIELTTHDVSGSADFYRTIFGWEITQSSSEVPGYTVATLDGEPVAGAVSALDELDQRPKFDTEWKVLLKVDSISEATAKVPPARGRIVAPPMKVSDAGRLAIVEDPGGAVLGLWESINFDGFTLGTKHGQPCWFEVMSTDYDDAKQFYASVVDWDFHYADADGSLVPRPVKKDKTRYCANDGNTRATSALRDADHLGEDASSYWQVYLAVDDIDATAEAIRAVGGKVLSDPSPVRLGRVATVADPQGAQFQILQFRD